MLFFNRILIASILINFSCLPLFCAKIETIRNLTPFFKTCEHLTQGDLVVIDIDYTLIKPCDEALQKDKIPILKKLLFKKCNELKIKTAEEAYSDIMLQREIELTDLRFQKTLKTLKKKQIYVLYLTATQRGSYGVINDLETWRLNDLSRLDLDFTLFPKTNTIELQEISRDGKHPIYQQGVLFSLNLPKGKVLETFLQRIDYSPRKIVFIDDETQHHHSVLEHFKNTGSDLQCFHYLPPPSLVVDFSLFFFQVDHYFRTGQWLDDETARLTLNLDLKELSFFEKKQKKDKNFF